MDLIILIITTAAAVPTAAAAAAAATAAAAAAAAAYDVIFFMWSNLQCSGLCPQQTVATSGCKKPLLTLMCCGLWS